MPHSGFYLAYPLQRDPSFQPIILAAHEPSQDQLVCPNVPPPARDSAVFWPRVIRLLTMRRLKETGGPVPRTKDLLDSPRAAEFPLRSVQKTLHVVTVLN